jgi:heme/copper-type cytochrome/quinol oxidase subunit 2
MHNDNDYWNTTNREREEKLRHRSFWERNRWMIIIISSLVVLVVVFASTTFLLLTSRQKSVNATNSAPTSVAQNTAPTQASTMATPTAGLTDTPTPGLNATVITSQPSASSITTDTKNYQFICITSCDDKFSIVLNTITINITNKVMAWNFTITDNGPICSYMSGNLELDPPLGDAIKADSGTFLNNTAINTDQALPRTAGFSSIPTQGVQYTAVLTTTCQYSTATYQSTIFSY